MSWNEFLHDACHEDNLELAEPALREGADPNAASHESSGPQTPLFWAAWGGRVPMARLLLVGGAQVAAEEGHESPSLHAAVEHSDAPMLALLLAADGQVALDWFDYVSRTPLMIAVEAGNLALAQTLIDAGADVNANHEEHIGNTALHIAAANGTLPMAKLLIEAGANPHIPGWMMLTPLDKAQARKRGDGPAIYALFKQAEARLGTR